MSLPEFDLQGSLFESLGSMAAELFEDSDRYKLFATKIWPLLAQSREELAECYTEDNGRPGIEPVVLFCFTLIVISLYKLSYVEKKENRQMARGLLFDRS